MSSVLLSVDPDKSPFLSSIKYNIIQFLPKDMNRHTDYAHIRRHLDAHYCPSCGEYMYCRYMSRRFRHNHIHYKNGYAPKLFSRIRVLRDLDTVVWERHNPVVMRLIVSREERFVGRRGRRIRSFYQWTIDEWNVLYPFAVVREDDRMSRLPPCSIPDILYTPDMI